MYSNRELEGTSAGIAALQQLKDLQDELQAAISAIARNSLTELELSLWRQEMLCATLKRSLFMTERSMPGREVLRPLRAATVSLQHMNRSYETLVQQSSQSMSLLQDLCSLYRSSPVRAIDHAFPSLSCEA